MSRATDTLNALADANGYVKLAVVLGGEIVPLGKALISEIHKIGAPQETVEYSALITADDLELDAIDTLIDDDRAAINAELAKLGKPPLPDPPAPAAPITQAPAAAPASPPTAAAAPPPVPDNPTAAGPGPIGLAMPTK